MELAIRAFHHLLRQNRQLENSPEESTCRLVIAGGYDDRLAENVEYHAELQELASSLGIGHLVSHHLSLCY